MPSTHFTRRHTVEDHLDDVIQALAHIELEARTGLVALDMMTEDGNADHHLTEDAYTSLKAIEGIAIHASISDTQAPGAPQDGPPGASFSAPLAPLQLNGPRKPALPHRTQSPWLPLLPSATAHTPTSSGGITFGTVG